MRKFEVVSPYQPSGDQGQAIEKLSEGFLKGDRFQTLKGVTGSGKTFTMAKIIEKVQRPTLIISHNKTLSAQLYREFKSFFPHNAVEYFVSYYDYYQPEAYVPARDLYIEKDASINDEIDKLRLAATYSLMERRDVIVVATVSCIYGRIIENSTACVMRRFFKEQFDNAIKYDSDADGYRLPTEAEWEYIARGENYYDFIYSGSDNINEVQPQFSKLYRSNHTSRDTIIKSDI